MLNYTESNDILILFSVVFYCRTLYKKVRKFNHLSMSVFYYWLSVKGTQ